ncbi:MAG: hypothetical protein CMO30_24590 [Tistrella sp.]|uniref:Uncharacterized protein n=1 Tax=Tistrella mobilis TaxID=171437 RepID=A0A3B9IEN3_9PROT|nr:hypothetical protein [Tistrella sp.]MAD35469.1 hypothetical protein [Tistrella sp.]MBA78458.1 hypothetical protein [Tistrella sp.]HAE45833.1 hypothetical protein [Tistrella mobilis]
MAGSDLEALGEAYDEAHLRETEARLKMLRAEKAAKTARAAHAKAEKACDAARNRWLTAYRPAAGGDDGSE